MQTSQSLVRIFKHALPSITMEELIAQADTLANSPNYWVPGDRVVATSGTDSAAEAAIQVVYQQLQAVSLLNAVAGAEYWVQIYEPGKGLDFHFDKDERLMKEQKQMSHPILSCILYLTGSPEGSCMGPTVVIDQRYDNTSETAFPEHPHKSSFVWPQRNMLAVFDGGLGHGVLDSVSVGQRITMLVNWWDHKPMAVDMTPTVMPKTTLKIGRTGMHCTEGRVVKVRLSETDEPQAVTVDDLLANSGLTIVGNDAISAIEVKHQGYQLYPVPSDQVEQFQALQTAAAFVANELLGCASDSE